MPQGRLVYSVLKVRVVVADRVLYLLADGSRLPRRLSLRIEEFTQRGATVGRAYGRILGSAPFLIIVVQMALLYSLMTTFHVIGPFLVQTKLGHTPVTFGKVALLLGVGWFGGNVLCNLLARRMPRERVTFLGLALALVVVVGMVVVSLYLPLSLESVVVPAFALFLVGGAVFPNLMGRALGLFPEAAGTAGALTGSVLVLGAAFSSTMATRVPTEDSKGLALAYLGLVLLLIVLTWALKRVEGGADG